MRRSPHGPPASPPAPTRLRLELDDRCRALARVIALVEGRGLQIGDLRYRPAGPTRDVAEAVIEIIGTDPDATPDRLTTLLARIESLPSVRRARVEHPALTS
ncbi:hypothetical protein [Euzebya rosea]|uniref:hypothetical protein n=1 Tax=Euzebya rosea TaxID=2052804 RepID=UPI00130054C2|nr:hypothetical protein [Euzebya rosea]